MQAHGTLKRIVHGLRLRVQGTSSSVPCWSSLQQHGHLDSHTGLIIGVGGTKIFLQVQGSLGGERYQCKGSFWGNQALTQALAT